MAEASISVDQDSFICPVCLDLLKDPVAVPCGHSFCKVCINDCWDQEDQRRVYSCPQCRQTFTPRPVLHRNNMLAEVVEKLKKTELQAAAADVECDFCTETKHKAIKSCLTCSASYCETHIKPHYQFPALKKHKLVDASSNLQEKICSQHDEVLKIYCRTDQSCVCYLCTMEEHKGHDTITAKSERTNKQSELKEMQRKCQQRLQEKQKKMEDVKQAVNNIKRSAQTAVSRAEGVLEQLEQEIADLKRRDAELEQLSHTEDDIHFLQSFQSLCVSSGSEDSSSISVHQHPSFDGVRKSLSELKERVEEFCKEEFNKISPHAAAGPIISTTEPKNRQDFLKYFCHLTLDPNTASGSLSLSENNRVVTHIWRDQQYFDHPEKFDHWLQVLSKERVRGRCYWEVEWNRRGYGVLISVSYKGIKRKGTGKKCWFGRNNQSWGLYCSTLSFWHKNIQTEISESPSSRIGVYVDHSAGTLSFYRVSDTMTLLHRVHTTFKQPLYAGFWINYDATVRLCDP